MHGCFLDTLA